MKKTDVVSALRSDFKLFLQALWGQLDLPSPTRAQYAIADYLQHGPKRLQIQAFRGVGKSWITGAFVLWTLFNDSEKKIMIISASKERADNMSIFLQKLIIETPWLSHLRPKSDDARWSRISFDVACAPHQAPSVKSVGISGQLTGSRADLLCLDDCEIPGNSMTEQMRIKLLQQITEVEAILTPKEDSRVLILGTPQSTFTVYRQLTARNYQPFVWPARFPKDTKGYAGHLAPQIEEDLEKGAVAGDPTDPHRFTDEDLLQREASMGRSNFLLQFQLDTSASDYEKFPIKNADFIVTAVNPNSAPDNIVWCSDPANVIKDVSYVGLPGDYFYTPMQFQGEWGPYNETVAAVDPSGRGKDETVVSYLSERNGILYLHEMRAYRDGYSDNTLLDILRGCKKYNVQTLLVESNFGDGLVTELFKKHINQQKLPITCEETRSNTRKEDRIIDTLEPVLNQHRLVINKDVIDWDFHSNPEEAAEKRLEYMLFFQTSRMCREKFAVKHDDRIDSLSLGVKFFQDRFAISAQEQIKQRKREEWNDMLEGFLEDPQAMTNHLVLGMNKTQRDQAKASGSNGIPRWVS